MVTRTVHHLVCDMTGDDGETVRTVTFGLGSKVYVTDLAGEHADRLENFIREYIPTAAVQNDNGTRATGRTPASREESQEIREYARNHGIVVSPRGRIPAAAVEAWENRKQ